MMTATIAFPSSHASLVSHPTEIAQLILNATKPSSLESESLACISGDGPKEIEGLVKSMAKYALGTGAN
jgi:hypothetical protein